MYKLILLVLFLFALSVKSQTDTAVLNKLSPQELLQYYINEKEPEGMYKGPPFIGDSLYNILNPLVIPTQTVNADAVYRDGVKTSEEQIKLGDTINRIDQKLKPKIALGVGRLGFYGNMYQKHFQSPLTARPAFDLNVSQRLTRYLQLNFNIMFGQLGANENTTTRHENFQSEIRAGGLNLLYDFGNFIPDRFKVRPFISLGITGFEFLSKTDLKDKNGNTYYYWSDGSIKDKAENAADAQFAIDLKRDYTYETDVRIRNQKINGKYAERAFAIPVGAGAIMQVTDRVDFKLNFQLFFTNTTFIDGITSQNAIGKLTKDKFTYTSFALQYDLISKNHQKQKLQKDTLNDAFWLAFDKTDSDKDGVPDLQDDCQGTPQGAAVDAKGCPLDEDKDGIPNYRDDELNTALGVPVNDKGVGQTDDYWQAWVSQYLNDSTGTDKTTEIVGNVFDLANKKTKLSTEKDAYTVELIRYAGAIPTDELSFLLSIGDIQSTTLQDGTTVVYTSGDYKKVSTAMKRRDEFRSEGNKGAGVSRIKGKNIQKISDEELEVLLKKEKEDELKLANNPALKDSLNANNNNTNQNNNSNTEEVIEKFGKDEIVYRVQLGAFKNKISTKIFNTSAGVLELKTGEEIFKYVTKGYKTIDLAAAVRADLVIQGYSDAFVTAYKGGKRILLNQTKATVDKKYKEDLNEEKMFSSVDKKLVLFKIQLGPLKKAFAEKAMDEKVKDLADKDKQTTVTGSIRYTSGNFNKFDAAEKYRKELEAKGFADGFIIATFKNEIISIQEAMELLK